MVTYGNVVVARLAGLEGPCRHITRAQNLPATIFVMSIMTLLSFKLNGIGILILAGGVSIGSALSWFS
jgi:hypothetical protein